MEVRVRYAPSPTGHLHIGGVRTALFNYLFAHHHGGQFILRSEDTDLGRNVPGAEEEILNDFRWLGLNWDEGPDVGGPYGPYRCTDRLALYQSYLKKLQDGGLAYPCFCTPEELEKERGVQVHEGHFRYSGKCRHLTAKEREEKLSAGLIPNWRLAVAPGVDVSFHDLIHGDVSFHTDDIGDFVIVKSNGIPTYNFQVVVDDALMRITHVIRGEEHLSNTPKQLLIYRALGFQEPAFAHLPQVLNESRKKLSKRDPNVLPVQSYFDKGYLPEALVNFLALLGWSPGGEEELMTLGEISEKFDLDRVNHSGAVFDADKLNWMAAQYIKQMPVASLTAMVKLQLEKRQIALPDGKDDAWLTDLVALYQEHMHCAQDFIALADGFFHESIEWSADALAVLLEPGALDVVRHYAKLAETGDWTKEASKDRFKQVQKALNVKGRSLYMPVRAAMTGAIHGPDLQQTTTSLPRQWVLNRLNEAANRALALSQK